jgi:hypothetical protein
MKCITTTGSLALEKGYPGMDMIQRYHGLNLHQLNSNITIMSRGEGVLVRDSDIFANNTNTFATFATAETFLSCLTVGWCVREYQSNTFLYMMSPGRLSTAASEDS